MAKVTIWKCSEHGEIELIDWEGTVAHCPHCGKVMEKVGGYDE